MKTKVLAILAAAFLFVMTSCSSRTDKIVSILEDAADRIEAVDDPSEIEDICDDCKDQLDSVTDDVDIEEYMKDLPEEDQKRISDAMGKVVAATLEKTFSSFN